jgi:VanZ family protein
VRKFAHFFAYLVLGILVLSAFVKSDYKGGKTFVYAFVICAVYASSDEIHQLFVSGRGCQIKDVLIDSGGALTGIALYHGKQWISSNILPFKGNNTL